MRQHPRRRSAFASLPIAIVGNQLNRTVAFLIGLFGSPDWEVQVKQTLDISTLVEQSSFSCAYSTRRYSKLTCPSALPFRLPPSPRGPLTNSECAIHADVSRSTRNLVNRVYHPQPTSLPLLTTLQVTFFPY